LESGGSGLGARGSGLTDNGQFNPTDPTDPTDPIPETRQLSDPTDPIPNTLGSGFAAIIGNPPFQGGKRITGALGTSYRNYLVTHLAGNTRGNADLCAYFFLRASGTLQPGGMAGLIATNTLAQGDTREVGLDQLAAQGFSIPRAVPSRRWPGNAAVEVAHLWLRNGAWRSSHMLNDAPVTGITPFLSEPGTSVGNPHRLVANHLKSHIGSIVLGLGFTLTPEEAQALITKDPGNAVALRPYLNGEDLNSRPDQSPSRWVINFQDWPLEKAETYPDLMTIVRAKVKPQRDKVNRKVYREVWWQYAEKQKTLYATIAGMERVLIRPRVSNTHAPEFVPVGMVYSEATVIFAFDQYKYFALLQSIFHETWAREYTSTMKGDTRYSPSDAFENFPFPWKAGIGAGTTPNPEPRTPSPEPLDAIGERYHEHRKALMADRNEGLTKTYNRFHNPKEASEDIAELRRLHVEMDNAVAAAYGWADLELDHGFHETKQGLRYTISEAARRAVLDRLLALNHERYAEEEAAGLHDKKKGSGTGDRGSGKRGRKGKGEAPEGQERLF
jgi:hypothetical protein